MRAALAGALLFVLTPASAAAAECSRVVVYTLPGITWADVMREDPPALLDAVEDGAAGSMSVKTNGGDISFASSYATIGAGARVRGHHNRGASFADPESHAPFVRGMRVAKLDRIIESAEDAGYGALPGALGTALGEIDATVIGDADKAIAPRRLSMKGRWVSLIAMDSDGTVDVTVAGRSLHRKDLTAPFGVATDDEALRDRVSQALTDRCGFFVIEQGDLARIEVGISSGRYDVEHLRDDGLRRADDLLAEVRSHLDESDLLLILSPTSPTAKEKQHLGIAIAVGPRFEPGSTLVSASTRRTGIVTLPDVAPTVLQHLDMERPAAMNGRPWVAVPPARTDVVAAAADLDAETRFIDDLREPFWLALFVVTTAPLALLVAALVAGVDGTQVRRVGGAIIPIVAALPVSSFLVGVVDWHPIGELGYYGTFATVAFVIGVLTWFASGDPLDRLTIVLLLTSGVLVIDLLVGGPLQINTSLGYSPIIAGRFAGLGNIGFAMLGTTTVCGMTLLSRRLGPSAYKAIAVVFAVVLIVDGAPMFGSDVGGVLALVPGFALATLIVYRRLIRWRMVVAVGLAAVACLGLFLVVDLSRPAESQTHLARLYEDIRARGLAVLTDTIGRKARSNLWTFQTSEWRYYAAALLTCAAALVAGRRGWWEELKSDRGLRAALLGGAAVVLLGSAVNDSGASILGTGVFYVVVVMVAAAVAMRPGAPAETR